MVDPRRVAILTIHGNGPQYTGDFARAHSWPEIQIAHLRRHTPPGYTVLAFGNDIIPEHEAFLRGCPEVELRTSAEPLLRSWNPAWPIRNWLLRQAAARFPYLVMLDSDAFPVADGWLERYVALLKRNLFKRPARLVAVQRLENGDTFSDRCFMVFKAEDCRRFQFDYSPMGVVDAGGAISARLEADGQSWIPLNRTNKWNPHPLTAGIYDDRIYHHAAGSRTPQYRQNQQLWERDKGSDGWQREVALHRGLMHTLFSDPTAFVARLRGVKAPLPEAEIIEAGQNP